MAPCALAATLFLGGDSDGNCHVFCKILICEHTCKFFCPERAPLPYVRKGHCWAHSGNSLYKQQASPPTSFYLNIFPSVFFISLQGLSVGLLKIPVISAASHSRLLSINSSSVTASNTSNTFPSKQTHSDFIQAHKCAPNPKSPSPSPARQRLQTELKQNT